MSTDLFSLGALHVSDFLAPDEQPRAEPFELRLVMDDDGLVHLAKQPPAELMWGRYWYRSGTNEAMRRALYDIVTAVENTIDVTGADLWVDIAANDGTLLSFVPPERIRVGVDPADDTFRELAIEHADLILQESFGQTSTDAIVDKYGQARVVTCAAMFYDLMDPTAFLAAVRSLLDREGLFVLQLSYTPLMVDGLAFDNICHEHARYYTLSTLTGTLDAAGFVIRDVELNTVNGGSMRVYAMRDDARADDFSTQPRRDVADWRMNSIHALEQAREVNTPAPWMEFWRDINYLREATVGTVQDAQRRGQRVLGYGASTKGNTLLQWFELDALLIGAIAERQEQKWGLRTVGTDIPIVSEETMRQTHPEYLLVLPWAFIGEFRRREHQYLRDGGKMIVPCPTFGIIEQ